MITDKTAAQAELLRFQSELPQVGTGNTEERVRALEESLYILHDKLRYLLSNLGLANFNDASLQELKEEVADGIQINAAAVVTETIYAENGDIAELTVDELSTSRRVKEWLLDNYLRVTPQQSDDNYLKIHEMACELITASVVVSGGTALTEHLVNRNGLQMYWAREIATVSAAGYPFDATGEQIYITLEPTAYPVTVYQYTDLTKAKMAFENVSGTYMPKITLGAGDGEGGSQAEIWKNASGLRLQYVTSGGAKTLSVAMTDDGYVDLDQMRKPTAYNFSGISNGSFTETVDGGTEQIYTVTRDGQGRITKITDSGGHETVVNW